MTLPKKVMLVFGTRPEAIKMAPLCHALAAEPARFKPLVCVTGQHRHMLDQVLKAFDLAPDIDLNLMKAGQDLYDVTSTVLLGMRDVLRSSRPDVVLVHGDTTTTLATGMASFYAGVPVGHVEAGLRTHDIRAPYPEEFNRQVTSKVARWHFAPTQLSRANLLAEGVPEDHVIVTGNTVIDSLMMTLDRIESSAPKRRAIEDVLTANLSFDWRRDRFVLVTGHRRENFGEGFIQICKALRQLAVARSSVHFVYPVHLNPSVQGPVREILSGLPNVHLVEPLDYEPFIYLLKKSYVVVTDSGGIQEEAPSLGKPVLVMRDVTERPEAVTAGTVRLVGAHCERIVQNVTDLLDNETSYKAMASAHNPYGDGKASARIVEAMRNIE